MTLHYDRIPKGDGRIPEDKIKKLLIISKPCVLCPFTKGFVAMDRCMKCDNYGGHAERGKKVRCKWPY